MAGNYANNADLLGSAPVPDIYSAPTLEPGKTVDLSGASGFASASSVASSFGPSGGASTSMGSSRSSTGYNGYGGYNGRSSYSASGASGGPGGARDRGPSSIEGGSGGGLALSLAELTPANIMRQLAAKPVSELVAENGKQLMNLPKYMARAYTAAASRYLQPWSKFGRISPAKVVEGLRGASRRGELQIHVQRNVLANAKAFCPNYAFIFLATMFMFVCTSPMLLCMLGAVGGGWSHAMKSEQFRNKPWTLQIGGVQVPLGANLKMAILSLPTLLFLHFFMGPVLWSAALYSGGASLVHAAVRDRDDEPDGGDGGFGSSSGPRIEELP